MVQDFDVVGCKTPETAFVQYGIPHGRKLRTRVRNEFTDPELGFDPSLSFFERLGRAFRDAFVIEASEPIVPVAVEAAIPDAVSATAHEFIDRPSADFDTVLMAFYQRVARYSCTYRDMVANDGERQWNRSF